MRPKLGLGLLLALSTMQGPDALGARFEAFRCDPAGADGITRCEIQLRDRVLPGEMLLIPRVQDADRIFFGKQMLGSTGYVLGRSFYAAHLPRLYSLQPLEGVDSPTLSIEVARFVPDASPPFTKVRVVADDFPLRKVYGGLLIGALSFALLALSALYLVLSLRRRPLDGWAYPEELRWFSGSLSAYLLLGSEWIEMAVPTAWSFGIHSFAREVSLAVCTWSVSQLLLEARFSDRSCMERGLSRKPWRGFRRIATLSFLACLGALLLPGRTAGFTPVALQALVLAAILPVAARSMEWQRIAKRSSLAPLAFYASLFLFGACLVFGAIGLLWRHHHPDLWLISAGAVVLAAGFWRALSWRGIRSRADFLVAECRALLTQKPGALNRLDTLCHFIEQEWDAARVSLISVKGDLGLVLSSAGRDAIPHHGRVEPKKMGPFLKRACREQHILYAPVAEELGQELRAQGLKHSSLALPFLQSKEVRLVLCLMAEEGERIAATDAAALDRFSQSLSLEILSAAAQHVAEERSDRLYTIARRADGILVEHLDHWGLLRLPTDQEERLVVGAALPHSPHGLWKQSPLLRQAHQAFLREANAIAKAVAAAFELVTKENQAEVWLVSPRDCKNPWLKAIGPEKSALLAAWHLHRQLRALAHKDTYLMLGLLPSRCVLGRVRLRPQKRAVAGALDLDREQLTSLHERLHSARRELGEACLLAERPPNGEGITVSSAPIPETDGWEIICTVSADKKEMRRLEQKVMEELREALREAA